MIDLLVEPNLAEPKVVPIDLDRQYRRHRMAYQQLRGAVLSHCGETSDRIGGLAMAAVVDDIDAWLYGRRW